MTLKKSKKKEKEPQPINRLTLHPFGRISVKLNLDAPANVINLGDIRTHKLNRKDLLIEIKGPGGILGWFYLARSKLAKIEKLQLDIVEE